MTPLEFLTAIDQHNIPFGDEIETRTEKPIRIFSGPGIEWEILSYYSTKEGMVLDIQPKESHGTR